MKKWWKILAERYKCVANLSWLRSPKVYWYQLGAVLLIVFAAGFNYHLRDSQWQAWLSAPHLYFADETSTEIPMVTTTDAAFFLSHARDYSQKQLGEFEKNRRYPSLAESEQPLNITDIPLLSVMLAHGAALFTEGNLILFGNLMIPFSIFLTVLMVGVLFWVAGYPAEGAIAALGFGTSIGFLARTSIGRIDTDQLLIFFLAGCMILVLLAARQQNFLRMIGFTLLTALMASLGYWWHHNVLFSVVIPLVLGGAIFLYHYDIKRAILAIAIFAIAINPFFFLEQFLSFGGAIIGRLTVLDSNPISSNVENSLIFPQAYSTITELNRLDIFASLATMTPHSALGVIGALGFCIWAVLNPQRGVVFFPFFVMGLLAFLVGRRFAFFASPFVWFGAAWLLMSGVRLLASLIKNNTIRDLTPLFVASITTIASMFYLYNNFISYPSFSATLTRTFINMQDLTKNKQAILATWWDYGYYAHFHSNMATLHDGGAQNYPRTHLIARGLASDNTSELIQITKFVATHGDDSIAQHTESLTALNSAIAKAQMPKKPLYLLVTNQMGGWMVSIAKLGLFDVESGADPSPKSLRRYSAKPLNCYERINLAEIKCQPGLLNLKKGTIGGEAIIGEVVLVRDGFIEKTEKRSNPSAWNLVIFTGDNAQARFELIHRDNWNSTYHALMNRAEYNPARLELVLDDYPNARLYRILR